MGFILALFYLMTSYLGTITVFGTIAKYHVQEILAAVVFFVSIPALQKTFLQKTIQSMALGGLAIAVAMSMLVGMNYYRGAITEFGDFIPNAFAYFLVVLHCRTKLRLPVSYTHLDVYKRQVIISRSPCLPPPTVALIPLS